MVASLLGDARDDVLQTRLFQNTIDAGWSEAQPEQRRLELGPGMAFESHKPVPEQMHIQIDDVVQRTKTVVRHHNDVYLIRQLVGQFDDPSYLFVHTLIGLQQRIAVLLGQVGSIAWMCRIDEFPERVLQVVQHDKVDHKQIPRLVSHELQRISPPGFDHLQGIFKKRILTALFVLHAQGHAVRAEFVFVRCQ